MYLLFSMHVPLFSRNQGQKLPSKGMIGTNPQQQYHRKVFVTVMLSTTDNILCACTCNGL